MCPSPPWHDGALRTFTSRPLADEPRQPHDAAPSPDVTERSRCAVRTAGSMRAVHACSPGRHGLAPHRRSPPGRWPPGASRAGRRGRIVSLLAVGAVARSACAGGLVADRSRSMGTRGVARVNATTCARRQLAPGTAPATRHAAEAPPGRHGRLGRESTAARRTSCCRTKGSRAERRCHGTDLLRHLQWGHPCGVHGLLRRQPNLGYVGALGGNAMRFSP